MCTLTLIKNRDQLILTHNRDENINRPAPSDPIWHTHGNKKLWYPKDEKGGGTWMACSQDSFVCLLNGGFEKHTWNGPYRHSRGLVPIAALSFKNSSEFVKSYDFNNIEPFTLIHINGSREIHSIVWDGNEAHIKDILTETAIWSSSTLYNASIRNKRASIFKEFLKSKIHPNSEEMIQFHNVANVGDIENNLIMKRENGVQTLSIFQFVIGPQTFETKYIDLLNENEFTETYSEMA